MGPNRAHQQMAYASRGGANSRDCGL